MNFVEKILDGVHAVFNINPATFSGAIDIIVVKQSDGSYKSTPWHVRFGKLQLLSHREKQVSLTINGELSSIQMKVGEAGEAFFVQECEEPVPSFFATSPITTSALDKLSEEHHMFAPSSNPIPISDRRIHRTNNTPEAKARSVSPSVAEALSSEKPVSRSASSALAAPHLNEKTKEFKEKEDGNYTWGWGEFPAPNSNSISPDINPELIPPDNTPVSPSSIPTPPKSHKEYKDSTPPVEPTATTATTTTKTITTTTTTDTGKSQTGKWKIGLAFLNMFKGNAKNNSSTNGTKVSSAVTSTQTGTDSRMTGNDSEGDEATTEYFSDEEDQVSDEEVNKAFDTSIEPIFNMDDAQPSRVAENGDEQQEEDKNSKRKRRLDNRSQEADAPLYRDRRRRFDVELSRCGSLLFDPDFDKSQTAQVFLKHKLTYKDFSKILLQDASGIFDKEIVFRIQGEYYPWPVAGPMMVSILAFGKRLSGEALDNLMRENNLMDEEEENSGWVSFWPWKQQSQNQSQKPRNGVRASPPPATTSNYQSDPTKATISVSQNSLKTNTNSPTTTSSVSYPANITQPLLIPGAKTTTTTTTTTTTITSTSQSNPTKYYTRSMKPTSKQIEEMKLKPGTNTVTFTVMCAIRGKQDVSTTLYLWDKDDTIVVSDIDGTITKSDVFGQILPVVFNQDWSQEGVAQLYSNITANGYRILYLTARAIGQAGVTKEFLTTLRQDGDTHEVRLPPGPVFMSPDRLLFSINREVILRKPEQFKVACLNDIKDLFSHRECPFYAGFGNRNSDAISYKVVGIPEAKIFIINHFGEVTCASGAYTKTYTKLNELVDEMFPPLLPQKKQRVEDHWSEGQYWSPRPAFSLEDIEAELLKSQKN